MVKLSYKDAGPGKHLEVDSMWSILQRGYAINPSSTALMSPTQPSNLLQNLVGQTGASSSAAPSTAMGFLRRTYARSTCFITDSMLPGPLIGTGLSWSFAQLRRGASRIGYIIEKKGVTSGSIMVVFLPTSAEWTLMLWVSALRCHTLVTVEPDMLEPGQEQLLDRYMTKLEPSVVVVGSEAAAATVEKCRIRCMGKQHFLGITVATLEAPQQDWTSLPDTAAQDFPKDVEAAAPSIDSPDRVAMIIFASGLSSGQLEGCVRTVQDIFRPLTGSELPPPLRPPVALVNTKASQSLTTCLLYNAWYSGNAGVLAGTNFDATTTISCITICRPIVAGLYPLWAEWIRSHPGYSVDKMSSLKFLFLSGAVTTVGALNRTQQTFPAAKISVVYGMKEASGMFGWKRGIPAVKDFPSYKGIVSCGTALPGTKMKIVGDDGKPVEQGEPGVLHLSGNFVASGYLDEKGKSLFYGAGDDRWYVTGDCAVMDKQERLFILGHWDDMILKDGGMISPATVENAIKMHYSESTPVVLGVATPGSDEDCIYVVLRQEVDDPVRMMDLVSQDLGESHRPAGVVDLAQLGLANWPLTNVGKLSIVDMRCILLKHLGLGT